MRKIRTTGDGPVLLVSRMPGLQKLFMGSRPNASSRPMVARSSGRALRIAGSRPLSAAAVDLAFTDGRMDGLELALNLRDTVSGLPVWLISSPVGSSPKAVRISNGGGRSGRRAVGMPELFRTFRTKTPGGGR